jgi:hypothetical protein
MDFEVGANHILPITYLGHSAECLVWDIIPCCLACMGTEVDNRWINTRKSVGPNFVVGLTVTNTSYQVTVIMIFCQIVLKFGKAINRHITLPRACNLEVLPVLTNLCYLVMSANGVSLMWYLWLSVRSLVVTTYLVTVITQNRTKDGHQTDKNGRV